MSGYAVYFPEKPHTLHRVKLMKRLFSAMIGILLLAAGICFHAEISAAVLASGARCVQILIPSLYLFSVLASLLVRSGILEILAVPIHRCSRKILHMDGDLLMILLFSQIAGYPIGAQLLRQMQERFPERRMEMFLPVCFGCGPSFLMGTVCALRGLPMDAAGVLLLSMILPNLLIASVIAWKMDFRCRSSLCPRGSFNARTFTESVENGASAMLKICSMVLVFAACMGIAGGLLQEIPTEYSDILRCVLEISCITEYLQNGGSLPMAAALLSFGGICVHLQNAAIFGEKFSWRIFWMLRLTAAACTYGICRMGMTWLCDDAAPVFLPMNPCRPEITAGSIVPSVCLMLMAILLLQKREQL